MLKRTMDATYLNTVANHPEVRPFLGGAEPLDLTELLANPDNVGLECDGGGFVVVKLEQAVFECHSLFLPEARGETSIEAMRQGLRYCFTQTDCQQMVTKCPEGNKAAVGGCRAMGFSPMFNLEQAWPLEDGSKGPVEIYGLSLHKWAQRDPQCAERGKWFHERLEQVAAIPEHFEDAAHNNAVGAAVLMFEAGNPLKAQAFYNQWARIAGYPPFKLISLNPVIVDMDQVIVSVKNGDMEVLRCR